MGVPDTRVVPTWSSSSTSATSVLATPEADRALLALSPAVRAGRLSRIAAFSTMARWCVIRPLAPGWPTKVSGDWLSPLDEFFSNTCPYAIDDSAESESSSPAGGEGPG